MDITPLISEGRKVIQGYKAGQFEITNEIFDYPVIVFPDRVIEWQVKDVDNITEADFNLIIENRKDIEILLFGGGNSMQFPKPELRNILQKNHIALEPMDTGAACRTYNLLLAEERKIAAALIPYR